MQDAVNYSKSTGFLETVDNRTKTNIGITQLVKSTHKPRFLTLKKLNNTLCTRSRNSKRSPRLRGREVEKQRWTDSGGLRQRGGETERGRESDDERNP
jgi:hypothetical protein